MTPQQFAAAIAGKRLTAKVRQALRMVLVDGKTWREAAHKTGVHESSIMRARKRIAMPLSPVVEVPPSAEWLPSSSYKPMFPGELGSVAHVVDGKYRVLYRFVKQQEAT